MVLPQYKSMSSRVRVSDSEQTADFLDKYCRYEIQTICDMRSFGDVTDQCYARDVNNEGKQNIRHFVQMCLTREH